MQSDSELSFVIPVDSLGMLQCFEYFVFLSKHLKKIQDFYSQKIYISFLNVQSWI